MSRRNGHTVVHLSLWVCLILASPLSTAQAKDWCSAPQLGHPAEAILHVPTVMAAFSGDLGQWMSNESVRDAGSHGFGEVLCGLSPPTDHQLKSSSELPFRPEMSAKATVVNQPGLTVAQHDPLIEPPATGFGYPMANMKTIRGFDGAKCRHQGVDIYEDEPLFGTGKPIYAIASAEVTFIGTPEKNRRVYGRRDRRLGTVKRGKVAIPRQMNIDGYGTVYPFTRNLGRARTGVFVVTKSLHPDYEDHLIRYMHLAAVHPDIRVGSVIKVGQEIGLMGSTAIMKSLPHLHLDMETSKGLRVNPAPLIGLSQILPSKCKPLSRAQLIRLKRRHVVRRGDSLWKIARKYKTTVRQLKRLNRLRRGHIKPGQKLRVR